MKSFTHGVNKRFTMPKYNQEIRNIYAGQGISDEFTTEASMDPV
jgi:hypothetical protein